MRKACAYVVYCLCVDGGTIQDFVHTLQSRIMNVGTTLNSYTKVVQVFCTLYPPNKHIFYRGT